MKKCFDLLLNCLASVVVSTKPKSIISVSVRKSIWKGYTSCLFEPSTNGIDQIVNLLFGSPSFPQKIAKWNALMLVTLVFHIFLCPGNGRRPYFSSLFPGDTIYGTLNVSRDKPISQANQ